MTKPTTTDPYAPVLCPRCAELKKRREALAEAAQSCEALRFKYWTRLGCVRGQRPELLTDLTLAQPWPPKSTGSTTRSKRACMPSPTRRTDPMTKETWTPTEEAAFVALQERRERVQAAMKAGVTTLVDRHFAGMKAEEKNAVFSILTKHADDWRDALAPFDSGVRAASQETAQAVPPSGWTFRGLPPDHRIGTPWPVSFRPDARRQVVAILRGGKHLGPAYVDSFAWGVAGDTSDIVAWRYAD